MGTVRENLTLAQPAATDEEIMQALLATGAYSFVMTLPEGLDTEVGHGARRLEPSQAQHLALARLSLLDPPLSSSMKRLQRQIAPMRKPWIGHQQ